METAAVRVARRAIVGVAQLPSEERAQLFDDVASILPRAEARVAKDAANAIRRSMRMQADFLSLLK